MQRRNLEQEHWQMVLTCTESLSQDSEHLQVIYQRTRFLIYIIYTLGLRTSEVTINSFGNIFEHRGKWWSRIIGKGNKAATLSVTDEMFDTIKQYRLC